jgi:hypothetical protein
VLTQMFLYKMGEQMMNILLESPSFQKEILNSDKKFDLVLYEIFGVDALVGLGQHFNCPVIGFATFAATSWVNQITGNPSGDSYIPNAFLSYTAHMDFKQRFFNTLFGITESAITKLMYFPMQVRTRESQN